MRSERLGHSPPLEGPKSEGYFGGHFWLRCVSWEVMVMGLWKGFQLGRSKWLANSSEKLYP